MLRMQMAVSKYTTRIWKPYKLRHLRYQCSHTFSFTLTFKLGVHVLPRGSSFASYTTMTTPERPSNLEIAIDKPPDSPWPSARYNPSPIQSYLAPRQLGHRLKTLCITFIPGPRFVEFSITLVVLVESGEEENENEHTI